ncbi:hypothetical protein RRG08_011002 [Elysia crispata]|uniref:Uncharacterized protein n=1 Tax=Elysia crispata TaxID=231223 RepID=A0AAE0ZR52_9GAST|nr:hypothetical protein RRG08_011002 [Elysia crispata]
MSWKTHIFRSATQLSPVAVQNGAAKTLCLVSGGSVAKGSYLMNWKFERLEKQHFMVAMTAHLATLNTALQGKGRTVLHRKSF